MTKNDYIMQGFTSELEKYAFWGGLAKFLAKRAPKVSKWAEGAGQAVRRGEGMKYFNQLGDTRYVKNLDNTVSVRDVVPDSDNFVGRVVGNVSRGVTNLTKDLSTEKGVLGNIGQFGKNIANQAKENFTNAQFVMKEVNPKVTHNIGDKVGRIPGLRKKVVGKTTKNGKDYYIMRRSAPGRLLQYSTTPEFMGATALAGAASPGEGAKDALTEYGLWGYARPLAYAKLAKDLI